MSRFANATTHHVSITRHPSWSPAPRPRNQCLSPFPRRFDAVPPFFQKSKKGMLTSICTFCLFYYYYVTSGAIRVLKIGIYIAPAPAPLRAGIHHQHPYVDSFGMEIKYGIFNPCRTDCACDPILLGACWSSERARFCIMESRFYMVHTVLCYTSKGTGCSPAACVHAIPVQTASAKWGCLQLFDEVW
jgi:hypothetical protein